MDPESSCRYMDGDTLTINEPVVYVAREIMILVRAKSITRAIRGGP
jgi:hypothetical protein